MKNTKWLHSMALVLPLLTTNAYAIVIPGLANTGVDGIGNPDSNYTLIASPLTIDPPAIGINKNPFWITAPAGSNWIGISNGNVTDPIGDYTYRLSFDLTGIILPTFSISADWTSDNGAKIFLNGVDTGIVGPGSFGGLLPLTIGSGFTAGSNTLDFIVTNDPFTSNNPTGLLVANLTATGSLVPVPAAVWLFGSGLLCLIGISRRKIAT